MVDTLDHVTVEEFKKYDDLVSIRDSVKSHTPSGMEIIGGVFTISAGTLVFAQASDLLYFVGGAYALYYTVKELKTRNVLNKRYAELDKQVKELSDKYVSRSDSS